MAADSLPGTTTTITNICSFSGKARLCKVRGQMHKRQWVNISDTVLISLRDFQDEKAEVIHRYTAEESRELLKIGELPEKCRVFSQSMDEDEEQEDNGFVIEDI